MVGATEGERLVPHLPIPIQWAQRPLTFFPFHCPTLYIIIYLQLITPTVQNTTGSYTYSDSGCYNCNSLYGVQLTLRFMQLSEFVGLQGAVNKLIFLLLYDSRLLRKWLQIFWHRVRVSLSKGQRVEDYSAVEDITETFLWKVREHITKRRGCLNTQQVVSKIKWAKNVACITDRN